MKKRIFCRILNEFECLRRIQLVPEDDDIKFEISILAFGIKGKQQSTSDNGQKSKIFKWTITHKHILLLYNVLVQYRV